MSPEPTRPAEHQPDLAAQTALDGLRASYGSIADLVTPDRIPYLGPTP